MSTFPGVSEEYLLDKQSICQVYDLYLHAIEIRTESIRESDFIAFGLNSDDEVEITEDELNESLKALNSI